MPKVEIPEPSGEVTYNPHLQNSYGKRGCFYVGEQEIENPQEDVEYFRQALANALAAVEYENETTVDSLASAARAAYYGDDDADFSWSLVSDDYRKRWRSVVRAVLQNAP